MCDLNTSSFVSYLGYKFADLLMFLNNRDREELITFTLIAAGMNLETASAMQQSQFSSFSQADQVDILKVLEDLENALEQARYWREMYEQLGRDTTHLLTLIVELQNRKRRLLTQYINGEDGIPEEM